MQNSNSMYYFYEQERHRQERNFTNSNQQQQTSELPFRQSSLQVACNKMNLERENLVSDKLERILKKITSVSKFDVNIFYFYKNSALNILQAAFGKFIGIYEIVLETSSLVVDEAVLDKKINKILRKKSLNGSMTLWFNDGSVMNLMRTYLRLQLLQKYFCLIESSVYGLLPNLADNDAFIQQIDVCERIIESVKLVVIDSENKTSKYSTMKSLFAKSAISNSVVILANLLA